EYGETHHSGHHDRRGADQFPQSAGHDLLPSLALERAGRAPPLLFQNYDSAPLRLQEGRCPIFFETVFLLP
ncbi:MAG: hypothetical protein AB7S59_14635, partial [Parvibaculaceae bacterium]